MVVSCQVPYETVVIYAVERFRYADRYAVECEKALGYDDQAATKSSGRSDFHGTSARTSDTSA
jgi:hypothetical protein